MITVSAKINSPVAKVWKYFTTLSNWSNWYGGGVNEVVPGWQEGAKIFWSLGREEPITKLIPKKEICISGRWIDTTFIFKPEGKTGTIVEFDVSDPKGGASFSDGGSAHKAKMEIAIRKLKECVENEN